MPLAILPALAGQMIGQGEATATVAPNGGLYEHWVPGNPLAALASPTYIQNGDVIFRRTMDREWLAAEIPSINLAADYLASLTTEQGAVKGAGYYLERPTRIESDGVAQCHAVDAFLRAAALNRIAGDETRARQYVELADRVRGHFVTRFWVKVGTENILGRGVAGLLARSLDGGVYGMFCSTGFWTLVSTQ